MRLEHDFALRNYSYQKQSVIDCLSKEKPLCKMLNLIPFYQIFDVYQNLQYKTVKADNENELRTTTIEQK